MHYCIRTGYSVQAEPRLSHESCSVVREAIREPNITRMIDAVAHRAGALQTSTSRAGYFRFSACRSFILSKCYSTDLISYDSKKSLFVTLKKTTTKKTQQRVPTDLQTHLSPFKSISEKKSLLRPHASLDRPGCNTTDWLLGLLCLKARRTS